MGVKPRQDDAVVVDVEDDDNDDDDDNDNNHDGDNHDDDNDNNHDNDDDRELNTNCRTPSLAVVFLLQVRGKEKDTFRDRHKKALIHAEPSQPEPV